MSYQENVAYLTSTYKDGFDISHQEIKIQGKSCYLCFINSLNSMAFIIEVIKGIYFSDDEMMLFNGSITKINKIEESNRFFFSGQCIVLYQDLMYAIETRNYPNQSTNEASNEQSIRGSHDSFTENIILNVGLIRRRIRNKNLVVKLECIGLNTSTDIALLYVDDKVDKELLTLVTKRLESMNDVDIMYDRTLVDHLFTNSFNPYPRIRYCERPDLCSIHLLQGYIVLIIDNSFNAIILPTTFFELSKQIEEYTQGNSIALSIRLIRLLAVFISLYLLPIFLLFDAGVHWQITFDLEAWFSLFFQVIVIEVVIEWIRLSYIHTPTSLTGIMGFLVIFLLGDIALSFKLYSEIILLIVVLCNVCNFVTPNYELSLANKLSRIFFSVATICFSWLGFIISIGVHLVMLFKMNSFTTSYMYPLYPFNKEECKRILLGTLVHDKKRSSVK